MIFYAKHCSGHRGYMDISHIFMEFMVYQEDRQEMEYVEVEERKVLYRYTEGRY